MAGGQHDQIAGRGAAERILGRAARRERFQAGVARQQLRAIRKQDRHSVAAAPTRILASEARRRQDEMDAVRVVAAPPSSAGVMK